MNDDIEDDIVCDGFPEHRGVRETYRGDDGIQWECTRCGAEGWEDAVTSDDYDNLPEGAPPNWTIMDELGLDEEALVAEAERGYDPDKLVPRRVAFIGQPSAGKTTTASCCGEREDIPLEEEPLDVPLPGFVGMWRGGKNDIARRAKDIVRGRLVEDESL